MLEAAVSLGDREVAPRAALALAKWLDLGRGEPDAARRFYRTAVDLGTGRTRDEAALSLALHSAATQDRETATALLHFVTQRRYRRAGVEPITADSGLRFATALGAFLTWPPAHGSARSNRRLGYRARLLGRRLALRVRA